MIRCRNISSDRVAVVRPKCTSAAAKRRPPTSSKVAFTLEDPMRSRFSAAQLRTTRNRVVSRIPTSSYLIPIDLYTFSVQVVSMMSVFDIDVGIQKEYEYAREIQLSVLSLLSKGESLLCYLRSFNIHLSSAEPSFSTPCCLASGYLSRCPKTRNVSDEVPNRDTESGVNDT